MIPRLDRSARRLVVGLGAAWLLAAAPARGQIPEPYVPDVAQRSGLVSRFTPPQAVLPRDPYRDVFYTTRWADYPQVTHPNLLCHNGLYGLPWPSKCVESVYPYFRGSPGQSSLEPGCRRCNPVFRFPQNLLHPFKPVGTYYSGGSYSPIFDLDPIVTGPGPNPWPWFYNWCKGG